MGPSEITKALGFSKQRASDILQTYKFGQVVAVFVVMIGVVEFFADYSDLVDLMF